jgi:hypothetical protein
MQLTRVLALALLLAAVVGVSSNAADAAKRLDPLVPGWERIFNLDWQVAERRGRPVVWGYLVNDSPYTVTQIQLLVDGLDANGNITGQSVSWVPLGTLTPFSRTYFEAPAPPDGVTYQVRVFAFDRVESGNDLRP